PGSQDEGERSTLENTLYRINLPHKPGDKFCKASSCTDTILYVPLETTKESLFGNPVFSAMNEDYIVVSDRHKILVFDYAGKFIRKIGRTGKGPGEFGVIANFILKNDTLFISSGKLGIDKYTLDGKYWGFTKLNCNLMYFCAMEDGGYAWYDYYSGKVIYFNNQWEATDTLQVEYNLSKYRPFFITVEYDDKYLVKSGSQLLFKTYNNDTIFDITEKERKPAIILNFGNKLLPDHLTFENVQDNNKFKKVAGSYLRFNLLQTDSFVYIIKRGYDRLKIGTSLSVYNRNTEEVKEYQTGHIKDDYKGDAPLMSFMYSATNPNTLVTLYPYGMVKQAYERSTPEAKEFWKQKLSNMDENSNPLLVIIKLK
ncbi:MAG TPA: 6-bladed beta-propeller, partial [Draconibacterium sp.]|nr:6-bladed beta-propeller [Draconibacterium sp.]